MREVQELLNKARDLDENAGQLWHMQALLQIKLKQLRVARATAEEGMRRAPSHAPLHHLLGSLYDKADEVEAARRAFREGPLDPLTLTLTQTLTLPQIRTRTRARTLTLTLTLTLTRSGAAARLRATVPRLGAPRGPARKPRRPSRDQRARTGGLSRQTGDGLAVRGARRAALQVRVG